MSNIIIYQFSRERVEAGDFSGFIGLYDIDGLPEGKPLAAMMNTLEFMFDGYNDHPDEVYAIPDIRRFCPSFHSAWPYWLYFCNLAGDGLRMMSLCRLKTLTVVKVHGASKCRVEYDPIELIENISADFPSMNEMCERAGMNELAIYKRTKAIFEYFNFPFDAPLPS
ncbi:MAG: hypothetical protein ABI680_08560 [Chthoniobacteraceae bacterium]